MCVESPIGTTVLIMHQAHNSEFSLDPLGPLGRLVPEEIIAPPKRSKNGKRTDFTNLIRGGTNGTAAGSSGTSTPSGGPSTHTDSGMATPSNPPAAPPVTSSSGPLPSTAANTGAATAPVEPGGAAATASSELSEALQPGAPSTANTGGSHTIDDLFQQLSNIRRELDTKHSAKKAPPEAIFFKSVPKSKPRTFHRQELLVSSQIIYANPAISYKPLGLGA